MVPAAAPTCPMRSPPNKPMEPTAPAARLLIGRPLGRYDQASNATGFVIAIVISLVLAAVVLRVYSAQQAPWALTLVVVAFPFFWFFAWVIFCVFGWWQDTIAAARRPSDASHTQPPPQ